MNALHPDRPISGARAVLLLAALVALFWRALLPAGFMPDYRAGSLVLTICTEQGIAKMAIDLDGKPTSDPSKSDKTPCAFAGIAIGDTVPLLAVAAAPLPPLLVLLPLHALTVGIGSGLAAPPPPSQGPPDAF